MIVQALNRETQLTKTLKRIGNNHVSPVRLGQTTVRSIRTEIHKIPLRVLRPLLREE